MRRKRSDLTVDLFNNRLFHLGTDIRKFSGFCFIANLNRDGFKVSLAAVLVGNISVSDPLGFSEDAVDGPLLKSVEFV